MRFTVVSPGDDIAVEAAKLHEIALEEAIEPSKASVTAAAGYQPLDFETFDHAENGEGSGVKAAKDLDRCREARERLDLDRLQLAAGR